MTTSADRSALNFTAAVSLSAWLNAKSWPTEVWRGSIIAKDAWVGGDRGYALRGGAGGKISFVVAVGGGWAEVQTTATVPAGGWHHVAGVYDGATMKIYLDGVEQATRNQTGALTAATGVSAVVGASPADATRRFQGGIAEAEVHGRALTVADVSARIQAGLAGGADVDPAIVLRLPLDEGTGASPVDPISGTAATVTGAEWSSGKAGHGKALTLTGEMTGVIAGDVMTFYLVGGGKFADSPPGRI